MWQAVYYENYDENEDRGTGKRVLPYSVLCKDDEEKKKLCKLLGKYGYKSMGGNQLMRAFLVNTQFKRWCYYPKVASMSCIDNRNYSLEEIQSILHNSR